MNCDEGLGRMEALFGIERGLVQSFEGPDHRQTGLRELRDVPVVVAASQSEVNFHVAPKSGAETG